MGGVPDRLGGSQPHPGSRAEHDISGATTTVARMPQTAVATTAMMIPTMIYLLGYRFSSGPN